MAPIAPPAIKAYSSDYTQLRAMPTGKDFHQELVFFNQLLADSGNFSLVRFGDGEMVIVNGQGIDLSSKYNGEHRYEPGNAEHEAMRARLIDSLHYVNQRYFVGIACPCCVGQLNFEQLKISARQQEEQLTWANLFVNANYPVFRRDTLPLLAGRVVNIVCHANACTSDMPFAVNRCFSVGPNSWINDYERLLDEMLADIDKRQAKDEVFLFCAGVLSNIVVYELTRSAPQNTYIDAGSVFDVDLGLGKTRKYLKKGRKLKRICRWN